MKTSLTNPTLINSLQGVTKPLSISSGFADTLANGQKYEAVVISQPRLGITHLNIGGQVVSTNSGNLVLTPGQVLQLQITQTSPQILMNLLSDLSHQQAITQGLRNALPLQNSSSALLANLLWLANPSNSQKTSGLPPELIEYSKKILKSLPDSTTVATAKGIKQAIQQSGVAFEAKLREMLTAGVKPEDIAQDFKAGRLQLLEEIIRRLNRNNGPSSSRASTTDKDNQIKPNILHPPPLKNTAPIAQKMGLASLAMVDFDVETVLLQMLNQLRASLARTELMQLSQVRSDAGTTPNWIFEVPVNCGNRVDIFHIVIEEEHQRKTDDDRKEKIWSLALSFDLPNLGPLHVIAKLGNKRLSINMMAEEENTVALIQDALPELIQTFSNEGIILDDIHCAQGKGPDHEPPQFPDGKLLDVQA